MQPRFAVGSDDEVVEQHKDKILERHKDEIVKQQRARDRKAGAEKRRAQGQLRLSDAAAAALNKYLDRDPPPSSRWMANQLQKNPATVVTYPKKKRRVPYQARALARKLTHYRRSLPPAK